MRNVPPCDISFLTQTSNLLALKPSFYFMSLPQVGLKVPKLVSDLLNLLAHLKFMVMMALFPLKQSSPPDQMYFPAHHADDAVSSLSALVPVSRVCVKVMIKLVTDLLNLLAHVKFMLMMALFRLGRLFCRHDQVNSEERHHVHDIVSSSMNRPSPALVPVPVTLNPSMLEPIKKRLRVVEFGEFLERSGVGEDCEPVCALCLCCLKRSDEMRELSNCCHAFHRECLDKWVDQCQVTCPLCRSKILPVEGDKGRDPWWVERMYYLYGEDW